MGDVPALADEGSDAGTALDEPDEDPPVSSATDTDADADLEAGAVEDANDQQGDKRDVSEATAELTDDDFQSGGGDLFSDVEDSETQASTDSDGEDGEASEDGDPMEGIAGGLDGNQAAMEDAINEGAARLAVVGLGAEDFEDSSLDKDGLEEEFAETFEAFRLGYFGSQSIDKYVLTPADGDVSPAWGLAGAMLMAAAMAFWMRPDGDEKVQQMREAVEGLAGGEA